MWVVTGTTGSKDQEQQLLAEEKPAQVSSSSSKNKPVGGDLTGAGKPYGAPLNKDQLCWTPRDI